MRSVTILLFLTSVVTPVLSAALQPRTIESLDSRHESTLDSRSVEYMVADLAGVPIGAAVAGSDAHDSFVHSDVVLLKGSAKRQETVIPEPDPNRNSTIPQYVFVLQCTQDGFRGDCLVFGASPGDCVSYFSFQSGNNTGISDRFNDKVVSLSTNTGGNCQWYLFQGCNNKGDDRGLTAKYNYNLGLPAPGDDRATIYQKQITSWRC